jgi:hypothetical protein
MDGRLIPIAIVLLAVSATAHGQGKGPTQKERKQLERQAEAVYAQCVYNQGGYVEKVQWFAPGSMKLPKAGDNTTVAATKPAFKTETILLGQKSCTGGKGTKNVAVLYVQGGKYARAAAIAASDIGAVAGMIGCGVGAAALTTITAGGGAAAAAGCEVVADFSIYVVTTPSIIPDAKEIFAIVQPPATNGSHPKMIVTYGTVFDAKTKVASPY